MGAVSLSEAPWITLGLLLGLLLLAAVACERSGDDLTGEEITYQLAARSLARDFDLVVGKADRQRLEEMSIDPEELPGHLFVKREDDPETRFGVPMLYPAVLAPFVWVAPVRGPAIANSLLLTLAAALAVRRLSQRLGRQAPALVALCVFVSLTYRSVFLVQPAILLLTLVISSLYLVFAHEEPAVHGLQEVYRPSETPGGVGMRWSAIGILLGLVAVHHPVYVLMAVPVAVAAPGDRRRSALAGLLAGLLVVLALAMLMGGLWGELAEGDSPFEPSRDQPLPERFSVGLTVWNLYYLLLGRNTGLLPYFLPLVALLGLWQGGSRRSVLVVTAVIGILLLALISPFNFFGGPAAVGNRWLIPWFAMLWFVPTRQPPRGWLTATILVAAPLMASTWLAPSVDRVTPDGVYRQAAGRLNQWLPVETSQREIPPPGQQAGARFWVRSLSNEATLAGSSRWRLRQGKAELQMATPVALAAVYLQFGSQAEPELEVRGGELGDTVLLPDGGVGFRVEELDRKALHPMWWSAEKQFNYVLRLDMPMDEGRAQSVTITAIAEDMERAEP